MADLCYSCGEYVGQNSEDSPYCKCHREELKKLKEIAEKYKLMMTPTAKDMEKALQIVERLKTEISWFKKYCGKDCDWSSTTVRNLLQKILGEKK